jgi:MFS family permease
MRVRRWSIPASQPQETQELSRTGWREWAPLSVLMVGTFVIVLDFFIVNVALPSIQSSLHADGSDLEWVVAGYGLTFAVFLVAAGRIGDRIGRRRAFVLGLWLFVVTSALCGLAPNALVLVAGRFAQGLGAALISPSVLALLGVIYPGARRVRAITVYGVVMGLAAASGQVIGGLLISGDVAGIGWRAVFLINVPVGLIGLIVATRLLPESRAERARATDVVGVMLVTAALLALMLPLIQGNEAGWPIWTWLCLAAASVLMVAFVVSQNRRAAPWQIPTLRPDRVPGGQPAFRVGHPACILVQPGFVLPDLRALPAERPPPKCPQRRPGVYIPRGIVLRCIAVRPCIDPPLRS